MSRNNMAQFVGVICVRILLFLLYCEVCVSLDNGLALSPPFGWITSERFACSTDCTNYPDDCISEHLVTTTVDAMIRQGIDQAGYKYVIIGDCWMFFNGSQNGSVLKPDPDRFADGMRHVADYVHQKGLKLGIQVELGNQTANGFPGCGGEFGKNAANFASWGVDLVLATGNSVDRSDLENAYSSMGKTLNQTGHPMVYWCNWAQEILKTGGQVDYARVASVCNLYSTDKPMVDSWESLEAAIKYFENMLLSVSNFSGPGHWHTANFLLAGDFGLSQHEQQMQMSVWSIMTSPIFVSADLRNLRTEDLLLLVNKGTLSINQDMLYQMGLEKQILGQVHIWKKAILPKGSYALLFMYFNISGGPSRVSVKLQDLGLIGAEAYNFTDVFTGKQLGVYKPWYTFDCEVDPVGSVFIRAVPLPPTKQTVNGNQIQLINL